MSDGFDDFEYFEQHSTTSGRRNEVMRGLSFSQYNNNNSKQLEPDDNIARIIASGGHVSPSPSPSPSSQSQSSVSSSRSAQPRMGFRAYQAALRENRDLSSYSSEQPVDSDDGVSPFNRSLTAAVTESEEEAFQLINISIYDSTNSASTILRMNRRLTSKEVCRALSHKMDLSKDEAMYHTLVFVVTIFDSEKRVNVHCVRTFQNEEIVLNVLDGLLAKLTERYKVLDVTRMKNTIRWYFKDVRTQPLEFPDGEDAIGEDSSDDEEEVSHSDLAYLAKAERKGYLLKRSSRDQNLWRKWYCVLTDHLWCIDIQKKSPTAICIRLSGMIRSSHHHNKYNSSYNNRISRDRSGTTGFPFSNSSSFLQSSSSPNANVNANTSQAFSNEEQQLHSIVINSTRGTHLLRAFNLSEQKKWIEELHAKTKFAMENDYFNMAEVIICDEENTKSKRFHKAVEELLEVPMFYESLSLDHRSLQYTTVTADLGEHSRKTSIAENDSAKSLNLPLADLSVLSVDMFDNDDEVARRSDEIKKPPPVVDPSMISTKVQFSTINPMDRTICTSSLHRMYDFDVLFTHLLRMVLDVLHFKELFRHDLFITQSYQRQIAIYIFVKYLLPIIQIQATSSFVKQGIEPCLDVIDIQQIASSVKVFSARAMKSNGFIQEEKELVRYMIQIQSLLERNLQSKSKVPSFPSRYSLKEDSEVPFVEDNNEQVNRLDLLWELNHDSLMKVYNSLFVAASTPHSASPLSLTGTTNNDRFTASGASVESNVTVAAKESANSSSFWSWFSTTPVSNAAHDTSDFRGNKSRFTEGSDYNTTDNKGLNYPSQDLFDSVLEDLREMLNGR